MDTTRSVQSALDLRELLKELSEHSAVLSSLEDKLENVSENIALNSVKFHEHLHEIETELTETRELLALKTALLNQSYKTALLNKLKEHRTRKSHLLILLESKTDAYITELQTLLQSDVPSAERTGLSSHVADLNELKQKLKYIDIKLKARKDKEYQKNRQDTHRQPA